MFVFTGIRFTSVTNDKLTYLFWGRSLVNLFKFYFFRDNEKSSIDLNDKKLLLNWFIFELELFKQVKGRVDEEKFLLYFEAELRIDLIFGKISCDLKLIKSCINKIKND